ncbi:MAG: hypothetical protein WC254_04515, partial [Candidatus Woesearchaeota archaeon]
SAQRTREALCVTKGLISEIQPSTVYRDSSILGMQSTEKNIVRVGTSYTLNSESLGEILTSCGATSVARATPDYVAPTVPVAKVTPDYVAPTVPVAKVTPDYVAPTNIPSNGTKGLTLTDRRGETDPSMVDDSSDGFDRDESTRSTPVRSTSTRLTASTHATTVTCPMTLEASVYSGGSPGTTSGRVLQSLYATGAIDQYIPCDKKRALHDLLESSEGQLAAKLVLTSLENPGTNVQFTKNYDKKDPAQIMAARSEAGKLYQALCILGPDMTESSKRFAVAAILPYNLFNPNEWPTLPYGALKTAVEETTGMDYTTLQDALVFGREEMAYQRFVDAGRDIRTISAFAPEFGVTPKRLTDYVAKAIQRHSSD